MSQLLFVNHFQIEKDYFVVTTNVDHQFQLAGFDDIVTGSVNAVRDMGVVFDPLVRDKDLAYDFDNAMMLQSIAAEIRYDLSLGMNDTLIRLSRRT